MKKVFIFGLLLAVAGIMTTGCSSCKSENKGQDTTEYHDYDGVVQDFTAGVANIQALHRQTMYGLVEQLASKPMNEDGYEWRNSRVIFNEAITYENIDEVYITAVNDVFYYWNEQGPWVQYINTNVVGGTQIPWPINDVWIEDANLCDKPIKLTAEDALARLKEWNGVLPQDCNFLTLRLPVGPKACNPQWTFGDTYDVLFIDAVTGEVSGTNPAFPL